MNPDQTVLVLDFGSQYTQLIARRVREQRVYSVVHPFDYPLDKIRELAPKAIIFSGGPQSVYSDAAPICSREVLELGVPTLCICYGMQLATYLLDGRVESAPEREYGRADIDITADSRLFANTPRRQHVWASHGDRILAAPPGFRVIASSDNAPISSFENEQRQIFGILFHPEVTHSEAGTRILRNFLFGVAGCTPSWDLGDYPRRKVEEIRQAVGGAKAIAAVSGGVDSPVAALLVAEAIGDQLTAIFVDNGVLRKNEAVQVASRLSDRLGLHFVAVDARERFYAKLAGVEDPEVKRKLIGNEFIAVFEEEAKKLGRRPERSERSPAEGDSPLPLGMTRSGVEILVQGTLYPDVIESVSIKGPSAVIKTHHNVGGLPEKMGLRLFEPVRELFKDEVRALGIELGLEEEFVWRHPFPGPGLAVRILGEVTAARVEVLQNADEIVIDEIRRAGLYRDISQAFAVLLPVRSVGVMGDERTYENVLAVRAVSTTDFMTADWFRMPHDVLDRIARRVVNEVRGVNRVVYDVSSKPPSTIEWE